jgi:hypothetical protein
VVLSGGNPNPFNSSTKLQFYMPQNGLVKAMIYNVKGEEIARLADGWYVSGTYNLYWDAGEMPSGIYFCSLITEKERVTTKLLLVK